MAADYALVQSSAHPMAGTWEGAAATDGPHRVMSLVDLAGTDGNGQPWTMPLVECFWIENKKIAEVRPFYWDQPELARMLASRGISEFRPTV